jgi:27-O-demethylrifamycin SV methyltransferase
MPRLASDRPDAHYDAITQAWRYLMGESFHYGYFAGDLGEVAGTDRSELDVATEELSRQMARRAELAAGHSVLDVGCGIGGPATFIAREFGCRVSGISTSSVGVEAARKRAVRSGLGEQLSFHVRDGMQNEFDDASFDRIWVMESSHLMPDKSAMILESARVLKPGGRLVLCDIIMHRDLPLADVLKRAGEFDLLRRVFGRAKMETLASYRGWCEAAGLVVRDTDDISAQAAGTFDRWEENAVAFRDEVVALIGEEPWTEFHRSCQVMKTMWNEQILGYGIVTAAKP